MVTKSEIMAMYAEKMGYCPSVVIDILGRIEDDDVGILDMSSLFLEGGKKYLLSQEVIGIINKSIEQNIKDLRKISDIGNNILADQQCGFVLEAI